jgi:aspartate aminotransferase
MRSVGGVRQRPRSGVRKMMELASGRDDVVHLEVGEPGFATPDHILRAASDAADEGQTHYSPTPGLPALREALAEKVRDVNRIAVPGSDQILVTNGGANALFTIFGTVLEAGDTVLLPDPGWGFGMMVNAVGARPKYYGLRAADNFLPDPDELRSLIDPTTRAIVLNSPSNPLGSVIPRERAEMLLELCQEKDLWLISDECYDQVDFAGGFQSIGSLEGAPDRVLSVFSFSKVYAMTGFRVGYCALPRDVAESAVGLLQASVLCVNTPAQHAALAALTGPQEFVNAWRDQYRENRDLVLDRLRDSPHTAYCPDGGFYVWMRIGDLGESTSEEWAVRRLLENGVAVTPGGSFGSLGEGHVRISLANDRTELLKGIDRLLAGASA